MSHRLGTFWIFRISSTTVYPNAGGLGNTWVDRGMNAAWTYLADGDQSLCLKTLYPYKNHDFESLTSLPDLKQLFSKQCCLPASSKWTYTFQEHTQHPSGSKLHWGKDLLPWNHSLAFLGHLSTVASDSHVITAEGPPEIQMDQYWWGRCEWKE